MKKIFYLIGWVLVVSGCGSQKTTDVTIRFPSSNAAVATASAYGQCSIGGTFDWSGGNGNSTARASIGGFRAWVVYPDGTTSYFPIDPPKFDESGYVNAASGDDLRNILQFSSTLKVPVIPGNNRRIVIGGVIYHHWTANNTAPLVGNSGNECWNMLSAPAIACGGFCSNQPYGFNSPIVVAGASAPFNVSGSSGTASISTIEVYDILKVNNFNWASSGNYINNDTLGTDFDGIKLFGFDGFATSQTGSVLYNSGNMPSQVDPGASLRPKFLSNTTSFSTLRIKLESPGTVINNILGFGLEDVSNTLGPNASIPFPIPYRPGLPIYISASMDQTYYGGLLETKGVGSSIAKFAKIWPLLPARKYRIYFFGATPNSFTSTAYNGGGINGGSFNSGSFTPITATMGSFDFTTSIGQVSCIRCNITPPPAAAYCKIPAPASSGNCSTSTEFIFNGCQLDTDNCS